MDIRKVKKLIELLEESSVAEIEIREGEESVRISRGPVVPHYAPAQQYVAAPAAMTGAAPMEIPPPPAAGQVVKSPMVGTFYTASTAESAPFVKIGQTIKVGDTLCIIEAMKIMNPIEAEIAGKVTAVLVENGHPVEYEQPLFIVE